MDQRVANSLNNEDIRAVFEIVSEATIAKRPVVPGTKMDRCLAKVGNLAISNALVLFLVMLAIAGFAYYAKSTSLVAPALVVGALLMICVVIFFTALILSVVPLIIKIKRSPYAQFLELVENSLTFDLQYVNRLAHCDRKAVQFVLSCYKRERAGFEQRGSLLSGSIEKIGIFPALASLAVLATALSEISFATEWIRMLAPLILAFYFLSLATFGMLEKKDRVIALLEYSIASRA